MSQEVPVPALLARRASARHAWVVAVLWLGSAASGRAAVDCLAGLDETAALNALLARGGQVALPRGTCRVSDTLMVPSHTTVTGEGIGVTILRGAPGAAFPVMSVGGDTQATGSSDVELSRFTVDGAASAVDADGAHRPDGIRVPFGSTRVRIHDVEVMGAGANGIEINGSDTEVRASLVHDNQANGIYVTGRGNLGGLNVVPAARVAVVDNQVMHNSLGKPPGAGHSWDGIDIDPISRDCTVRGNLVRGNDIILFENAHVVPFSSGHRVFGNTVTDSPDNGIVVEGPQHDFAILANHVERITGWGIVINGSSAGGVIRDNTIRFTTAQGILVKNTTPLTGAPDDIAIIANSVMTTPSGPGHVGIAARQSANHLRIEANRFIPQAGQPPPREPLDLRFAGPDVLQHDNR